MKIPRKLKKGLKLTILKQIDPAWKSSDLCIKSAKRNHKYGYREPTFKGLTVTHYTLGL